MRFRPTPKDTSFFELLAESARYAVKSAELLEQIALTSDVAERKKLRAELHVYENKGDEVTHSIHAKLSATFVTPMDRDDLAALASNLDNCLDYMDEAGDMIVLYRVEEIPTGVKDQIEVLKKCAHLTADAMPRLVTLENLREYWMEINSLENEGDSAYRHTIKNLFDSGIDPIEVIKLKDISTALERGIDSFENLATAIETIYVKES